jgi:hypothetical protein
MSLDIHPKPWYRELWFWLLVAPLLTLLVSVPIMLITAFKGADNRVVDNYYHEGRMINHRFEEQALAVELGISGQLGFDWASGEVWFISNKLLDVPALNLLFSHPSRANQDFQVVLYNVGERRYRADLSSMSKGRWYIALQGIDPSQTPLKPWRLLAEINIAPKDGFETDYFELAATLH